MLLDHRQSFSVPCRQSGESYDRSEYDYEHSHLCTAYSLLCQVFEDGPGPIERVHQLVKAGIHFFFIQLPRLRKITSLKQANLLIQRGRVLFI